MQCLITSSSNSQSNVHGEFFNSKGSRGCAALESILLWQFNSSQGCTFLRVGPARRAKGIKFSDNGLGNRNASALVALKRRNSIQWRTGSESQGLLFPVKEACFHYSNLSC